MVAVSPVPSVVATAVTAAVAVLAAVMVVVASAAVVLVVAVVATAVVDPAVVVLVVVAALAVAMVVMVPVVAVVLAEVAATVVFMPGQELKTSELQQWCSGRMARHTVPSAWSFTDRLPRTPTQKIARHRLVEMHQSSNGK